MTTVGQLLERKGRLVYSVTPESSVADATKLMADKGVGTVLVLENGHLKGILSERDVIRRVLIKNICSMNDKVPAVMTKNVIFVKAENTLEDCMELMTHERIRHLPVMQEDEVMGVVSIGDMVKFMLTEKEQLISHYEKYIYEG